MAQYAYLELAANDRLLAGRRPQTVPRSLLYERLTSGLGASSQRARPVTFAGRLTLVCGPAGFGKTTLVRDWLQQLELPGSAVPVAWRTLEPGDDDPARYSRVLSRTLAAALPAWKAWVNGRSIDDPDALADAVVALATEHPTPALLVLDDYHVIDDPGIHRAMAVLLAELPAAWHLTLITREDPPLPLGRLRAQRELVEIRARELRFTREEAAAYLNGIMDCGLEADEIDLLESRTEGWIAGLHLAAHSLRNQPDRAAFLNAFAGDDRYVAEYLLEEVVAGQPPDIQSFLQQTCILDRLHPDLCSAVTQREDSEQVLWGLEQANLFLLPLDNKRSWYRYHGLFADLLRHRLGQSDYDAAALHSRASRWYEANNMLEQSIDHAFAAGESERAADLLTAIALRLFQTNQLTIFTRWLSRLPDTLFASRSRLGLAAAWAYMATGKPEEARRRVTEVEKALGLTTSALCGGHLADLPHATMLALVEAAAIEARLAADNLALERVRDLCRCALSRMETLLAAELSDVASGQPPRDGDWPPYFNTAEAIHPVLLFDHGLALKFMNKTADASRVLSAVAEMSHVEGNQHLVALSLGHLAHIERLHGRLKLAFSTCERGLTLLTSGGGNLTPMAGLLVANQGNVAYERNDLDEAESLWNRALELAQPWQSWETNMTARLGLARLCRARGDLMAGVAVLDRLEEMTTDQTNVLDAIVAAFRAWFLAEAGETHAGLRWVEESTARPFSAVAYINELEQLSRARVLLAAGQPETAGTILENLIEDAHAGGRHTRQIEALILLALVHWRQDSDHQAMKHLETAMELAQDERMVRPFLDAGPDMAMLLARALDTGRGGQFARRLSSVLHDETIAREGQLPEALNNELGLVEPLSERELEVLQLIECGLTNKEIGQRLFLTEGTVKNHAHSLYGKLQVNGRTKAIAKARMLGLIDSP